MKEFKMTFAHELREQAQLEAKQALEAVEPSQPPMLEPIEPEVIPPKIAVQKFVGVPEKKDKIVHAMLDAKLEKLDEVKDQFAAMDMDKWSKIFARLHTDKNVKVDANITAMGIFAMFPVAVQDGE